jgi:hypothetical protein
MLEHFCRRDRLDPLHRLDGLAPLDRRDVFEQGGRAVRAAEVRLA